MVEHLLVAPVEARPVEQQVVVRHEVVRPLLVFEKFLPHEQHRNAGRGQAEPGRDAGPAAGEPGARDAPDHPSRAMRCSRPR